MSKFTPPEFTSPDQSKLELFVNLFNSWLSDSVDSPVRSALRMQPKQLEDVLGDLAFLSGALRNRREFEPRFLPLLKTAILHSWRVEALDVEERKKITSDAVMRTRLEEILKPHLLFSSMEWFEKTEKYSSPRVTDFLSIQYAEDILKKNTKLSLPERKYDDKFHILYSPDIFIPDLTYYRATCELRSLPLCVAYMDIDDFKKFNADYEEPRVDRDILPVFMSVLEAHVYFRGLAYREGGDEYLVILPNMSCLQAVEFLASFQESLKVTNYPKGIERRPTVSIGVFEVSTDTIETDYEVKVKAARAKNHAKESGKESGKSLIATCDSNDELHIAHPKA